MLLSTTTVTVERPTQDGDPYETPTVDAPAATGLAAHVSAPNGSDLRVGGDQTVVDAVLLCPSTPVLHRTDQILDEITEERWEVAWVQVRIGLGLDHQRAGLVRVGGAAGG